MRLIYFTESYPYGLGEDWKKNELNVLNNYFDDIIVIPFKYGCNNVSKPFIPNITYVKPLSKFLLSPKNILIQIFQLITSSQIKIFFYEFLTQKVFLSYSKFKQWFNSSIFIENLIDNPIIHKYLIKSDIPTIAYFFWGRNTSEVVSVLKNKLIISCIRFHRYDLYDYVQPTYYLPYQQFQLLYSKLILPISFDGKNYLNFKYSSIPIKNKIKIHKLGTSYDGSSHQSTDNILRIFSCSMITTVKRIHIIAEALDLIYNINIVWTHIGGGPEQQKISIYFNSYSDNIKPKITGLILPNKVKSFYVGKPADLFINVSSSEGIPVSIMEAMSASIPVFATNVGGTNEIVNKNNGKLLPIDINPSLLSSEIMNFFNLSRSTKQFMRRNSFKTFKENHDSQINSELLSKEILSLFSNND